MQKQKQNKTKKQNKTNKQANKETKKQTKKQKQKNKNKKTVILDPLLIIRKVDDLPKHNLNGSQLAKMKKSIPDMSLP